MLLPVVGVPLLLDAVLLGVVPLLLGVVPLLGADPEVDPPLPPPLLVAATFTVNAQALQAQFVPLPMAIWPVVASLGTVICTVESLTCVIPASRAAPTQAAVMPVNPLPVIVTVVPGPPLLGVKLAIYGCGALAACAFPSAPPIMISPAKACIFELNPNNTSTLPPTTRRLILSSSVIPAAR